MAASPLARLFDPEIEKKNVRRERDEAVYVQTEWFKSDMVMSGGFKAGRNMAGQNGTRRDGRFVFSVRQRYVGRLFIVTCCFFSKMA